MIVKWVIKLRRKGNERLSCNIYNGSQYAVMFFFSYFICPCDLIFVFIPSMIISAIVFRVLTSENKGSERSRMLRALTVFLHYFGNKMADQARNAECGFRWMSLMQKDERES